MNGRAAACIPMAAMTGIRRILSIDGGGIKGALPAGFLMQVEEATGERIVDHFDLIVGTSTGGIIAIGLGLGIPAAEILSLYRQDGPAIFGGLPKPGEGASRLDRAAAWVREAARRKFRRARNIGAPKHDSEALRAALVKVLGERCLGESLTRLVIPAYNADLRTVCVLKTSHHERFEVDWKMRAVDAALATAAAPTYFRAHELPNGARLVDGGVWANNPIGLAVVEAVGVLGWDRSALRVLSLGCTEEAFVPHPEAGLGHLALDATTLLMQGQSFGSWGTAKILAGPGNVHRVNPVVPKGLFSLDDVSKVDRLAGMGAGCARHELPMVRREFLCGRREDFVPFHGLRAVPH